MCVCVCLFTLDQAVGVVTVVVEGQASPTAGTALGVVAPSLISVPFVTKPFIDDCH